MQAPQPNVVGGSPAFGPTPLNTVCPSCHASIESNIKYEPSNKTHLIALAMCVCSCWLCCFLPYCIDSCQNGNHYCPKCGAFLGAYVT